jgi:hypothetical protein
VEVNEQVKKLWRSIMPFVRGYLTVVSSGTPEHPIVEPGPGPEHPIFMPPEIWPSPGVPTHPIVLPEPPPGVFPPPVPSHPIVILPPGSPLPPGHIWPELPSHPIVLPPAPPQKFAILVFIPGYGYKYVVVDPSLKPTPVKA